MKNLLLILAFVSIGLTGFSQTFSLSSGTPGQTQQIFTVSIPSGHGYTYSYTTTATNSTVVIVSYYKGTIAWLSNPTAYQQQSSGSGNVGGSSSNLQTQDNIVLIVANGASYCYGYAQITVNPY
jgi:hypothetical protein